MEDSLPEELIVRIFGRLPIKPLIRFTCLSKRWHFIILSDPHFAKSQFLIASQNKTLSRRLVLIDSCVDPGPGSVPPQLEFKSESHDLGENYSGSTLRKLRFPFSPPNVYTRLTRISSCNGLVCVAIDQGIYIWNPTTGSYTTLPAAHNSSESVIQQIGFGYVSSSDDYKLIASIRVNKEDYVLEYLSFSVRDKTWKRIKGPPPDIRWNMEEDTTLVNESIHWLFSNRSQVGVFDLAKEEWKTMQLPKLDYDLVYFPSLALGTSLGGSLCLLDYDSGFADLWVMTEYGVMDSWSHQFTFETSVMPHMYFFVMETSILVDAWDERRICYRLIRTGHEEEEEEVLELCKVHDNWREVIVNQETLLWLP